MAAHQQFDLDTLGSTTKFEELCYALLQHFFSSEVVPYGALGRDGGIDARLDGASPGSHSFEGIPLLYTKKKLAPGFWVFQAKYHQFKGYESKTPIADLKKEWDLWKNKRSPIPDYFLFLTNIVFTPEIHKAFREKIKNPAPFKFFDYWDGAKITAFVSANQTIRSSYFPNCEDLESKLNKLLDKVTTTKTGKKNSTKKAPRSSVKKPKASSKKTYFESVEELAMYEAAFASANTEILERFKAHEGETPKGWKKTDLTAPGNGVLKLSEKGKEILLRLISASESRSLIVRIWKKYLGEEVEQNEAIASIAYDPEDEELISFAQKNLFSVTTEKSEPHKLIDQKIRKATQQSITALRTSDQFVVEERLRELFRLKSQYLEARKKFGSGFYPNSRKLGRFTFGWSFLSIWDKAFESIADIFLSESQTEDLSRLMAYIPESLSITAMDNRMAPDEIVSELTTFILLLFKSKRRNAADFREVLLERLDEAFEHFYQLQHSLKDLSDAEWAYSVIQNLADFSAEIGKYSLKKDLDIEFNYVQRLVGLATSMNLANSNKIKGDWRTEYSKLKELEKKISELQHEVHFAFGTYAWFLCRKGQRDLQKIAISELTQVPTKEAIRLYNREDGLRKWYYWWFIPEGKNRVWSSRPDHDIRESLILRLSLTPSSPEDLVDLSFLESAISTTDFIKDLDAHYDHLQTLQLMPSVSKKTLKGALEVARRLRAERLKDKIRSQTLLSESKITSAKTEFREAIKKNDTSGALYQTITDSSKEFEPSHYVGIYTVKEKEWFLDDTGFTTFSISGLGAGWAEAIIGGREQLLFQELNTRVNFSRISRATFLNVLDEIRGTYNEEFVMAIQPSGISWYRMHEIFKTEYQLAPGERAFSPRQRYRIGNVDVFFDRNLKEGQFAVFNRNAFTWRAKAICQQPRIELIDPDSKEGLEIKKQYPDMDLSLKMIVETREQGTMQSNQDAMKSTKGWQVIQPENENSF